MIDPESPAGAWWARLLVLTGRGAAGLLPLIMIAYASRHAGVEAAGTLAALLGIVAGVAEISDVSSQRHVVRIEASGDDSAREHRLRAFRNLRVLLLILGMGAALAVAPVIVPGRDPRLRLVLILATVWFFLANFLYARALARGQFATLGLGPIVALAAGGISLFAISRLESTAVTWAVAWAIHIGKAVEVMFVGARTGLWASATKRAPIRDAWKETRFLFLQGVLSAANGKLIIPLSAWAAGPAAAAGLSIGLSFVSVFSIAAAAVLIPSYRKWATTGRNMTLNAVVRRSRGDWLSAFGVSSGIAITLVGACPWLLAWAFNVRNRDLVVCVALITVSGVFETFNLFAGACYQICFRDRLLWNLSALTMFLSLAAVIVGGRVGGAVGLGASYLVARAVSAGILCWPLLVAVRREPSTAGRP